MIADPVEPESLTQSLLGSVRSHLEDRLRSPFAGAFVLAWIAVNWKAILILAFSSKTIEQRIAVVIDQHFEASSVVLWPLVYASAGLVAYYLASTVSLALFELYGVCRRSVERWFDQYRWVEPETYMALKQATRAQVAELTELASDHLHRLKKLEVELKELESKKQLEEDLRKQAESEKKSLASDVSTIRGIAEIAQLSLKNATEEVERCAVLQQRSQESLKEIANILDGVIPNLVERRGKASIFKLEEVIGVDPARSTLKKPNPLSEEDESLLLQQLKNALDVAHGAANIDSQPA